MHDQINYSALLHRTSTHVNNRSLKKILFPEAVLLSVVVGLSVVMVLAQTEYQVEFVIAITITLALMILILGMQILDITKGPRALAPSQQCLEFAQNNGFVFEEQSGAISTLIMATGSTEDVNRSLSGSVDGLSFQMTNHQILTSNGINSFIKYFSVVQVSDPRIMRMNFAAYPRGMTPYEAMLDDRFYDSCQEFEMYPLHDKRIGYDVSSSDTLLPQNFENKISGLISDVYPTRHYWIECYEGSIYLKTQDSLSLYAEDAKVRFEIIEAVRNFINDL